MRNLSVGPFNDTFTCENVNSVRGSRTNAPGSSRNAKLPIEPTTNDFSSMLLAEIRQLREEVIEVKNQNTEIKNEMSAFHTQLQQTLMEHSRILGDAQIEIDSLRSTVNHLQNQIAARDQEDIKNDIEITGLEERDNENLLRMVIVASQKIGVEVNETDIDDVMTHPHPRTREISKGHTNTNKIFPRPIVVKLVRKRKRDELLKAAKSRRNTTSENIVEGQQTPIYINERLTRDNRQLFRLARSRTKDYEYRYCWIRNGGIFVRKADGKQAIRISNPSDLDQRIGPAKDIKEAKNNS